MNKGTVKWFNSDTGFGFITRDNGEGDIFAHFSQIDTDGYRTLNENDRVSFDISDGPKGEQATNIKVL